jgi:hypothetical protein
MNMSAITPDSLMTLEAYARARKELRPQIVAHRRLRSVSLGEHLTVQFEDEQTVRYQIQEMLRIEKIFELEASSRRSRPMRRSCPTAATGRPRC